MITTLNKIRAHKPCADGWEKLLRGLGKTQADDEPLPITTILDLNGIDDALWCLRALEGHDQEIRLYAVWCARRVKHLMTDPRSINALDIAERYARGMATDAELLAARSGGVTAMASSWPAVASSAMAAAASVASEAAWAAASAARWSAQASDADRAAQAAELRRICEDDKP